MYNLSERKPCSDGSCIGTINEKGYCNTCGKFSKDFVLGNEILEKVVKFPDLPKAPTAKLYQSVFLPLILKSRFKKEIHLEDYSLFFSSIQNAAQYRLPVRISNSLIYPVSQPTLPIFPEGIELSPRQLPSRPQKPELKWYDYVLFGRLREKMAVFNQNLVKFEQQKRKIDEINKWLLEVYRPRREEYDKACQLAMREWKEAKSRWETEASQEKTKLEELKLHYQAGNTKAVVEYFSTQLNSVPLPTWCPREYEVEFDKDGGILLLNIRLPYLKALEVMKTRELQSGPTIVPANQREAQVIRNQWPFLIVLRLIWEIPQVDYVNRVGLVACNGYVIYDDPGTGQQKRDIIMTVAAKKEDLKNIKLERIEPEVCFRSLKGIAAAKISDLVPVQPLIRFNKEDSRFISSKEMLDALGDMNIATMDWQDFEYLIRELFEKEFGGAGAEVKVTQASRDRGVDAIVFDPDPIHGGKYVIQAKRYTNIVDVSAVRDLYGTILNEGANRGILVTTSNYGRDAYDFAKDKPITLINGENLLYLLQKHGYYMKIDIKEAKRILNT